VLITMREAIRLALRHEMQDDDSVIIFGEDVAEAGGVFKVTDGLLAEFGPERVRDTPIAETAIVGAAIGAAAAGLRPVIDIMFAEFCGVAMDQIATQAAKMRYLSAGTISLPLVIRMSSGGGIAFGAQHSQTLESWFLNTPGLTIVSPSRPQSAYSLLRAAIRDQDPVLFLEPKSCYGIKGECDTEHRATLGRAEIVREGKDVTIVALGQMVLAALEAADKLNPTTSCEVIDLMTLKPWDRSLVINSVAKTHHLVIVEENPLTGGWGADIASAVAAECFGSLRAPVARVTCPDSPVPFGVLEHLYLPSAEDVRNAVTHTLSATKPAAVRWAGWADSSSQTPVRSATIDFVGRRAELANPTARFERMVEIRLVEEAIQDLFYQGLIAGTTHTCQGQEAVAVGLASVTLPSDTITCTYRGHGVALALGMTPYVLLSEVLGKRTGCALGRGGSMHLSAPDVGLLPTFAIVGAGIPVAAGAALAAQYRRNGHVAVAVFGDGATNIGAFHEALNLSAVWKLPVVFICENNLYGEYSRIDRTTPIDNLAIRGASYGIPGETVDGQDIEAVSAATLSAVGRARNGGGPSLLEMKTYRYAGHSRADPAKYRPAGELERWKARDPLFIGERRLLATGLASEADIANARARASARVEAAVAAAIASDEPQPADVLSHVYSLPRREAG
jgi:pyruvate/2-oxoglutarate/acetoin dehydrogenase E1 component/TPP-dependent pyruvate/acetoin dehydrogenase alpha subunit